MSHNDHQYWCVSLQGSAEDLRLLASFEDVDWRIENEDGKYFLVAPEFQQCLEAVDVWELADKLIPDIELAANILFLHFKGVRREKVFEVLTTGERHGTVFVSARFGVGAGMRVRVSGGRTPYKETFESIRRDPDAREAAHYFALRERGWTFFLWKSYELIRQDVTSRLGNLPAKEAFGPSGLDWIDPDQLDRFASAVHDPRASGDDARHAVPQKHEHLNPMRRSEAESFIRSLLLKWTQWKYANLPRTDR